MASQPSQPSQPGNQERLRDPRRHAWLALELWGLELQTGTIFYYMEK